MNSNQRSEGNNQSHNGSNELDMNSARAGTADRNNIDPATQRGSEQSGSQAGSQQGGGQSGGMQSGSQQSGGQQSGQPGTDRGMQERGTYEETGGQPSGAHQPGFQNADAGNQQSTDRSGSQTGNQQSGNLQSGNLQSGSQQSGNLQSDNLSPGNLQGDASDGRITNEAGKQGGEMNRQSNDSAGGLPRSPAGNRQSADQKMDDDTGLSNTANREPSELDQNLRQERQSNVGRRSDGTPD